GLKCLLKLRKSYFGANFVVLSHVQKTKATSEPAYQSPNFHITSAPGRYLTPMDSMCGNLALKLGPISIPPEPGHYLTSMDFMCGHLALKLGPISIPPAPGHYLTPTDLIRGHLALKLGPLRTTPRPLWYKV
ncbi:hypothetical protein AVEN_130165-1, partial [Araneus ventricosus]